MRAVVPAASDSAWTIVGRGTSDGVVDELSIEVTDPEAGESFIVRTMSRTGARMGPNGSVHGMVTDSPAIAGLAVGSLLLGNIPSSLSRSESRAAVDAALSSADEFASDRDAWSPRPLVLEETAYALWVRDTPDGTAAHADLGWATVAMWTRAELPDIPFRLAEIED